MSTNTSVETHTNIKYITKGGHIVILSQVDDKQNSTSATNQYTSKKSVIIL